MDANQAYHRIKFQAHSASELGRVGGLLVDRIDVLEAEVRELRRIRGTARGMITGRDNKIEELQAEVHALRNDRRNARGFVEAMRARGSMPEGTYLALLGYLGDAPSRATEGEP